MSKCNHTVFGPDNKCRCGAKEVVFLCGKWTTVVDFGDGIELEEVLEQL